MGHPSRLSHSNKSLLDEWSTQRIFRELYRPEEQAALIEDWWENAKDDTHTVQVLARVLNVRPQTVTQKSSTEILEILQGKLSHPKLIECYDDLLVYDEVESLKHFTALFTRCFPFVAQTVRIEQVPPMPPLPPLEVVVELLRTHEPAETPSCEVARMLLVFCHRHPRAWEQSHGVLTPLLTALLEHRAHPLQQAMATFTFPDPLMSHWYRFSLPANTRPVTMTPLDELIWRRRASHAEDRLLEVLDTINRDLKPNRPQTAFLRGVIHEYDQAPLPSEGLSLEYWLGHLWVLCKAGDEPRLRAFIETQATQLPALYQDPFPAARPLLLHLWLTMLDLDRFPLALDCLAPWVLPALPMNAINALMHDYLKRLASDPSTAARLHTALVAHLETVPASQLTFSMKYFLSKATVNPPAPSAPSPVMPVLVDPWALTAPIGTAGSWLTVVIPATKGALPSWRHALTQTELPADPQAAARITTYRDGLEAVLDPMPNQEHQRYNQLLHLLHQSQSSPTHDAWMRHLHLYAGLVALAGLDQDACDRALVHLQAIDQVSLLTIPTWIVQERLEQLAQVESPGLPAVLDWCTTHGLPTFTAPYRHLRQWLIASEQARRALAEQASVATRPTVDRWADWDRLLHASIAAGDHTQMEQAIGHLIELGQTPRFIPQLITILKDPMKYDPILDDEEATSLRIQLLEETAAYAECVPLVQHRFHRAVSREDYDEAVGYLDQLKSYPVPRPQIQAELDRWQALQKDTPRSTPPVLSIPRPVTILFIGGDETQQRYDDWLIQHYTTHPYIRLKIIHPGWVTQWYSFWERHRETIRQADWLVILTYMRTDLHKKLREQTGKNWKSCTGHGRTSIQRTIDDAGYLAIQHLQQTKTTN